MNWDDVRIFLAVSRAESLSGAAPVLRLDPATLGRRIARLEDSLGGALFVKSPQGYALTDLGARLRDQAEGAETALTPALHDPSGQGGLTGQIRIGAPDGCANFLLPQVCAAIQSDNPALDIQVLALPRVVNLSKREADMAITVSPPDAGRLSVQKITDYHLHLAAPKGMQFQTLADLRGERIVGYIPDMIFDKELDYLGDIGARTVHLASNSVSVQLNMLRQGGGVGIVHDFAMPFAPELQFVLQDALSLTRAFYLVRHLSDRRSDRLTRFADLLMDGLRREVARLEAQARLTAGGKSKDAG
ncbi:LysR family transcriptional regulator [Octadecabacter sp. R77987]|uniref:LysR family transcriptional regulator n=1 Tax=Octadecabacter sp. R77987 TaxID=3093874 RepID=UPI00366D81C9